MMVLVRHSRKRRKERARRGGEGTGFGILMDGEAKS